MPPVVRRLTSDDAEQAAALSQEAFGPWPAGTPTAEVDADGRRSWGAFDGDELIARMTARPYESWWYGAAVRTTGIAGVAVRAEARGGGLLEALFRAVLAEAAEHGEVLSTLYPTAPGHLPAVRLRDRDHARRGRDPGRLPGPGAEARRVHRAPRDAGRRADRPRPVRRRGPRASTARCARTGPSFPATDEDLLTSATGVSLALDGDEPVGYALWQRSSGYDAATSSVSVRDLVALTPRRGGRRCGRSPRRSPRSSARCGCAPPARSAADPVRRALPGSPGKVVDSRPYMLRVSDVAAALARRRPGDGLDGRGPARRGRATPSGRTARTSSPPTASSAPRAPRTPPLHPRGLALAFAGVAPPGRCARTGCSPAGPTAVDGLDAFLDGAGRPRAPCTCATTSDPSSTSPARLRRAVHSRATAAVARARSAPRVGAMTHAHRPPRHRVRAARRDRPHRRLGLLRVLHRRRAGPGGDPVREPSDDVVVGEVDGRRVAFLARHGQGHRFPPHRVNYRANLWALRAVGVRQVLAPCAVGSLRPELGPGTLVVPDQVVDRTLGPRPHGVRRRRARSCTSPSPTRTARAGRAAVVAAATTPACRSPPTAPSSSSTAPASPPARRAAGTRPPAGASSG